MLSALSGIAAIVVGLLLAFEITASRGALGSRPSGGAKKEPSEIAVPSHNRQLSAEGSRARTAGQVLIGDSLMDRTG
jgi:hypothetical protein